jgi:hypothetical protein
MNPNPYKEADDKRAEKGHKLLKKNIQDKKAFISYVNLLNNPQHPSLKLP